MPHSQLLRTLEHVTREHPFQRKLLIARTPAEGRELLHALSAADVPWIGWKVTTLRQLATELAAAPLAQAGLRLADDFDVQALVDEAIDALNERNELGPLGQRRGVAGVRDAIRSAVGTLRGAGIEKQRIPSARPGDAKLASLAAVIGEYEIRLRAAKVADSYDVFRYAIRAVQQGDTAIPESHLYLVPGHPGRGLAGRLVRLLTGQPNAKVLATDSVLGLPEPAGLLWEAPGHATSPLSLLHAPEPTGGERPEVTLFAAATPVDELREILRRLSHDEIPWDRVEIIATDAITYGAALDALTRRLEVPVTFAEGVDIRRTRVGRAMEAYLRWIEEGFPADVLRGLLESGDLEPLIERAGGVSSAALARRLRRLRVGWGQDRYLGTIEQALGAATEDPRDDGTRDQEDLRTARERERKELRALATLLRPVLVAIPSLVSRTPGKPARTSPAALAAAALVFLEHVPAGDEVDHTLRKVYRQRLDRIRATLTRETRAEGALATLRARLETRVAPEGEDGLASWTSTGGCLHLSNITTGGFTGRPHLFVVGLDAGSVRGGGSSDPLLTESDRQALNHLAGDAVPPLPTSADRAAESRHSVAALLARLRGKITLSYSAWDAAEGRSVSPAPELLQVLRLREGDPFLLYEELYRAVGPLACAVPSAGRWLDGQDVWLGTLAPEGRLLSGIPAVRSAFAGLDQGLLAQAARGDVQLTEFHGRVTPRAGLDPGREDGPVFSASRLETLGTCPRRYYYQYVLGVYPPNDPEWDADRWLSPGERGTLLHVVYHRSLHAAREQGVRLTDAGFGELALAVLAEEAETATALCPPPSDTVQRLEMEQLRRDVLSFVTMIRDSDPDWYELELRFGTDAEPVTIRTRGGPLRVRGAIDRVDRTGIERFRIVDYKTGGTFGYRKGEPFRGGRRIQHVVYMAAAKQLLGGEVEAMEYHFPTQKGENQRVPYTRDALTAGGEVLEDLLSIAADGLFIATEDASDCRYCDFGAVCRVDTDRFGKTSCGPAAWSKANVEKLPEYARLARLRGIDG
ncbi:hypothetical protein BH23GEM3_BH23GEM3_05810 [soil metagenome]